MPIAKINGIKMYYELHGQGYPLVVINGLAADVLEFRPITRLLAVRHRVLVFDNRGVGRSDKPDQPYSIEQMAKDTLLLMRTLGIHKAAIMGISMGSRIAMELTLTNPSLVSRLILVSGSARVIKSWRRFILMNVIPRLPIGKGKRPQPYYAFARQRQASSAYNAANDLHKIRVPTLILQGSRDRIAPLMLAEEMHARIRGSVLRTFPGGHLFYMSKSRPAFIQTVTKFVSAQSHSQGNAP
jgi:3-oxoadipate enol-lactonase